MRYLVLLCFFLTTAWADPGQICRITFYCPGEGWGDQVSDPTIRRATKGRTIALENSFEFGTTVIIPGLRDFGSIQFVCQDRGTAVNARKASYGKYPVVDVFCNSKKEVEKYSRLFPHYMRCYFK